MRRIVLATVGVCAVAVVVAALGFAQPAGNRASARAAAASALPPLPAEVKDRGRWNIAVKCDSPPFGYIDVQGKHAGFDVEIAKWFSRFAFGKSNRVTYTCVTTPAREPALTTGRVDLVIATFTYTADRDTRIDFSRAYYKATGRLLVRAPIRREGSDRTEAMVGQLRGASVGAPCSISGARAWISFNAALRRIPASASRASPRTCARSSSGPSPAPCRRCRTRRTATPIRGGGRGSRSSSPALGSPGSGPTVGSLASTRACRSTTSTPITPR